MKNDAASRAGRAVGKMLNELADKSEWRERRQNAILDAFRMSTRHEPYAEVRDRLFRERGLGAIDD